MTEPLTLTKLIILYMLDRVEFPLTKAQIFDFVLEKEYANYFTLQQATCELTDSHLVEASSTHSSTLLTLLDEGRETLKYFQGRISEGIKSDITEYFEANKMQLHNEVSVSSNYYRIGSGEYVADLSARENSSELFRIQMIMPTEDTAKAISENWKESCQDIYSYLLEKLL